MEQDSDSDQDLKEMARIEQREITIKQDELEKLINEWIEY
jgi:hypothetical protein